MLRFPPIPSVLRGMSMAIKHHDHHAKKSLVRGGHHGHALFAHGRHNAARYFSSSGAHDADQGKGAEEISKKGAADEAQHFSQEDSRKLLELVRKLQSHGVKVLGSTIIGLENHTPENMDEAIDYAARYNTDFHQFMLYTPIPGTPLHAELSAQGRLKDESEFHVGDIHGQLIFNYRHAHIHNDQEADFVRRAFERDFEVNGPSIARIVRTMLAGWKRYKSCPDRRVRRRFAWESRELGTTFSAVRGASLLAVFLPGVFFSAVRGRSLYSRA